MNVEEFNEALRGMHSCIEKVETPEILVNMYAHAKNAMTGIAELPLEDQEYISSKILEVEEALEKKLKQKGYTKLL